MEKRGSGTRVESTSPESRFDGESRVSAQQVEILCAIVNLSLLASGSFFRVVYSELAAAFHHVFLHNVEKLEERLLVRGKPNGGAIGRPGTA